MDCDLCLFLRRARAPWQDRSGMLPVSLTSDCKLKVLSETITLEAARKYDPPGFSGAANLRVGMYFAFTQYLQWAQNKPPPSDREVKSCSHTRWSFMHDGVSFSSLGLSYENLSHFCGTMPPCKLRWRICGETSNPLIL